MAFRPQMTAAIENIVPLDDVCSLIFDRMAIDLWRVRSEKGAAGDYVSRNPRFVFFFDGATISLGAPQSRPNAPCVACYVPAGLRLFGRIETPLRFEHLDIHVEEAALRAVLGPAADLSAPIFLPECATLRSLAGLLAEECRQKARSAGYAEALAAALMHEVFHVAGSGAGASAERAGAWDQGGDWLARVKAHVLDNLDQPITVDELSGLAGMSRSRFNRRFQERTGRAPYRWVMEERVRRAQSLLLDGLAFAEVAHETGFSDQAHFSRVFHAATGAPPGRWAARRGCSKR